MKNRICMSSQKKKNRVPRVGLSVHHRERDATHRPGANSRPTLSRIYALLVTLCGAPYMPCNQTRPLYLGEIEQKAHAVLDATQVGHDLCQGRRKLHVGVSCQDQA